MVKNISVLTDEEIIDLVISNNIEAYEEIVKRYEKKLKRYVMRIINRKEETEDIVQNTFIKAYKNLRTFNNNLKFSSWIYRIAHNESVNMIKSSWLQKIVSLDNFFSLGRNSNIEEKIDKKQVLNLLKTCIKKLDVKYKEPLVLFYYEEKSYEEISNILRIPIKTVGVLIYRGRKKLKEFCKNEKK